MGNHSAPASKRKVLRLRKHDPLRRDTSAGQGSLKEPRKNPTSTHVHELLGTYRLRNCQLTELGMVRTSKPHNAGIFSIMKLASVSAIGPSVRRNALLFKEGDLPDGM